MPGRRSSTDSSRSRSLSPYNKRRRGRSPDMKGRRSRSPDPRSRSRKSRSRSLRRSRSPRRRSPRRYTGPPPRRRSSPSRGYGNRRSPLPSGRGRSPPLARKRSPSPRGRRWTPSPKRRSPSPRRKRSPEQRLLPPPRRPSPPHAASRDKRSPIRGDPHPYQEPPGRHQRELPPPQRNRSLDERLHSTSAARGHRSRSRSPVHRSSSGHAPPSQRNILDPKPMPPAPVLSRGRHKSPPYSGPGGPAPTSLHQRRRHSPSPKPRRRSSPLPPERSSREKRAMSPIVGSKDMDYRDKRLGDPRARKGSPGAEHHKKDGSRGQYSGKNKEDYYAEEPPAPPKKELGYTAVMTHVRFNTIDGTPYFKPRDIISIAIERNIIGNEPALISPVFKPELVVVMRKAEEGKKPLCQREEFLTREEEYEERRVVKVVQAQPGGSDSYRVKDSFDLEERENYGVMPLSERWGKKPKIQQQVSMRKESLQYLPSSSRNVDRSDSLRHGDRDERLVQPRRGRGRSFSPGSDKDERIISQSRSGHRKDEDLRLRDRSAKYEKDPNDLRHNLARKRREHSGHESYLSDARQKIEKRRVGDRRYSDVDPGPGSKRFEQKEESNEAEPRLPDFSKRPDKGMYQEWKGKPEMIPKHINYYEVSSIKHDTLTTVGKHQPLSKSVIRPPSPDNESQDGNLNKKSEKDRSAPAEESLNLTSRGAENSRSYSHRKSLNDLPVSPYEINKRERKSPESYSKSGVINVSKTEKYPERRKIKRINSSIKPEKYGSTSSTPVEKSLVSRDMTQVGASKLSTPPEEPYSRRMVFEKNGNSNPRNYAAEEDRRHICCSTSEITPHTTMRNHNVLSPSQVRMHEVGIYEEINRRVVETWPADVPYTDAVMSMTQQSCSRGGEKEYGKNNSQSMSQPDAYLSSRTSEDHKYRSGEYEPPDARRLTRLHQGHEYRSAREEDVSRVDSVNKWSDYGHCSGADMATRDRDLRYEQQPVIAGNKYEMSRLLEGQSHREVTVRNWSPIEPPPDERTERLPINVQDFRSLSFGAEGGYREESYEYRSRRDNRNFISHKHDNRDDENFYERRGRGRGCGFRGRPFRGRGNRGRDYAPRPPRSSAFEEDWKHDKFQDNEEPSSTTK